jgi:hypothetical protein
MRETIAVFGAALLGASAVTWGGVAHAQQEQQIAPFFTSNNDPSLPGQSHPDVGFGDMEQGYRRPLAAPTQAFELKLAGGYTQGFGNFSPSLGMPSVAGAGVAGNLDIDYRMTPHASVGVMGQYAQFSSENNAAARGVVGNIGITYHGAPYTRADPWIRFGAGYRLLWSVHQFVNGAEGPTVLVHGFELGALNLGYDLRLSEGVAIAPMAGVDLNLFIWDHINGGSSGALSSAQVATFVFAGIQGRFDGGGSSSGMSASAETPNLGVW